MADSGADPALAKAEPVARLGPAGFDPGDVFAVSSSACFYPEEDDPENFDGSMITWTFAAPKDTRTGAGIYRLQFIRILTPEERGNTRAQLRALADAAQSTGEHQ
jgi:hypothetical protein